MPPLTALTAAERHFVLFLLDGQAYALPLKYVTRAVRMAAITPIPESNDWVIGFLNVAGQVLPVIDLRRRFGQAGQAPQLSDRLLLLRTGARAAALMVDEVLGVETIAPERVEAPPDSLTRTRPLTATLRLDDRLALALDPERLLPPEEHAR